MKQFILNLIKLIVCALIILAGVLCLVETYSLFNISNEVVGHPIIFEKENVEEFLKYDLGYISFNSEDDKYISVNTFEAVDFDGTKDKYILFFNGDKLNTSQSAGVISSILKKKFYNTQNEVSAEITISITLKFTASQTMLTFETTDSGEDMAYFNTYQNINGATLIVAKEV